MSYASGTSTGPKDLLDKLRIFLLADGWTVNKWDDDDTTYEVWAGLDGDGKRLHVQKVASSGGPTMYFNFRAVIRGIVFSNYSTSQTQYGGKYQSEITGLGLYGSIGYDGGEAWDNQPGHSNAGGTTCWGCAITELSTTAIPAYYFFSYDDTVVVCVEYTSGKYMWLAFGCLAKEGAYTGGQFFAGSLNSYSPSRQLLYVAATESYETTFLCKNTGYNGNAALYLDIDSAPGWRSGGHQGNDTNDDFVNELFLPGLRPNDAAPTYSFYNTFLTIGLTRSPNFYNSLAPFWPLYLFATRTNGNLSLMGILEGIRAINPEYYDPAEEVVLGSDTWMIFPAHAKDDNDARMGFAVLKNV